MTFWLTLIDVQTWAVFSLVGLGWVTGAAAGVLLTLSVAYPNTRAGE